MSLETGGRADKIGNAYENRFLAKLFLRLIDEKIKAVIVEPLGEESIGVEYIVLNNDNTKTYYQCKASNAMHDHWRITDLKKHCIFEQSKKLIEQNPRAEYKFISPLSYRGLSELCDRARSNNSPEDFVKYQLTNKQYLEIFKECANAYNLTPSEKTEDLREIVFLLSKSYFETVPNGSESVIDLEELICGKLTGDPQTSRILLEQYAISTQRFGIEITATEIIHYLESKGIKRRLLLGDRSIQDRINQLNALFKRDYKFINDNLIHRRECDEVIEKLKAGKSVILHGKAGSGKSGCLHEIINNFEHNHILYLAVRLDKKVPSKGADKFGKDLELPESPIFCLRNLAANNHCVLILDQLDSLRWTNMHSKDAIDVCRELIMEAETINQTGQGSLSIIFVSRTFDLEIDTGIRSLFERQPGNEKIHWEKICMNLLSPQDVEAAIGEEYNRLSSRLRKLLQTPSSLYIWSLLDTSQKRNTIKSVHELMSVWESQIWNECEQDGLGDSAYRCINIITSVINKNHCHAVPESIFAEHRKTIEKLISSGLLSKNNKTISFTHQSFLDYFTARDIITGLYSEGKSILEFIKSPDKQMPNLRYRLLFVLQTLIDDDIEMFIIQANNILKSDAVRYYYKCAVFDVIGQYEFPDKRIYQFIMSYYEQEDWKDYIYRYVFAGHPQFIKLLQDYTQPDWREEKSLFLLESINEIDPDFIESAIRKYIFQSDETDKKLYGIFSFNPANDSDSLFKLRLEIYERYPYLLRDGHICSYLIPDKPERAIQMLAFILKHQNRNNYDDSYLGSDKDLKIFIKRCYKNFVITIFPLICKNSANLPDPFSPHFYTRYKQIEIWSIQKYYQSFERNVVEILKMAMEEYAASDSEDFRVFISNIDYSISNVGYEIILHGLLSLREEYSSFVLFWLLKDFKSKIFIYTYSRNDYLYYTKEIIKKFSSSCDIVIFKKLENLVYRWQEDKEKMIRNYSQRHKRSGNRSKQTLYYPFWGSMQKELLPVMDRKRLSDESRSLISVLNRNIWISTPAYAAGIGSVETHTVQSPLDDHLEKISDKSWLKLLTSSIPLKNMSRKAAECFIETDKESFARSLYDQATRQQTRFATLSLSFPDDIYEGYIAAVLNSLTSSDERDLDENLIIQCIQKFKGYKNNHIALALIRLIDKYHNINYPDDILNMLEGYAEDYPDHTESQYTIISTAESDNISLFDLTTKALNGVQSYALLTIASLVNSHPELMPRFKSLIKKCCDSDEATILFSVLRCAYVYVYYEAGYDFAIEILKELLSHTILITMAREFWNIIVRDYPNDSDYYRNIIIRGCNSKNKEVANNSSELLCAIAVYFNDDQAYSYLITNHFSSEQENRICNQAVFSFARKEYHEESLKILSNIVLNSNNRLDSLLNLFQPNDKKINFERDLDFVMTIINSPQITQLTYYMINYIIKDDNLSAHMPVLKVISERIFSWPDVRRQNDAISSLIRCLLLILDMNKDNMTIREQCLNIWDELYRRNCMSMRGISNLIEEFTDK